ncbi:hypothetical protein DEO72_LG10g1315 [Vigna unguiculata]|uniref:Uncharacterized protein n=1 Tax=Vigna unguiculata TaxID=3917 RepID=A0A4D6NC19_VIGUN|nr:hypothetical protein DEO72_LG10g1315 [Vigna unguiculata]
MTRLWRPVPMIICAANLPRTLNLMNFLRSLISGSTTAVAESTRKGALGKCDREKVVAKERECWVSEKCEKKKSEERKLVRVELLLTFLFI